MSTIIMMFILPIGIMVYFWDKRNYAQKLNKIDEMFYHNGYKVVERSDLCLVVAKKAF